MTISPARVRKPRDKAKVEAGVLLAQRWILARLRHMQFFSLAEANQAITPLLTQLNQRQFKKMPGSRRSVFETMDFPALKPLPIDRYEFAEWKKATVGIDYHIEVDGSNERLLVTALSFNPCTISSLRIAEVHS